MAFLVVLIVWTRADLRAILCASNSESRDPDEDKPQKPAKTVATALLVSVVMDKRNR